jgi:FkbM family methyltransferase
MSTQEIAWPAVTPPRLGRGERLALTAAGLRTELAGSFRLAADRRSFARLALDGLGYRLQRAVRVGDPQARRRVRFKDGTQLIYRLNRGDVRAIAEVWMSEAYRLPFAIRPRTIIDIGANIGTSSVWFARRYGASQVLAVEPAPDNAELAQLNLAGNGVAGEVLQAAIGPHEGEAHFELNANSALGRIGDTGIAVKVVTPQTLLDRFPAAARIDLVKIDIEGGEQALFDADLSWLERVDCLVLELHADRVDCRAIISGLEASGLQYVPMGEDNDYRGLTDIMAAFRRV